MMLLLWVMIWLTIPPPAISDQCTVQEISSHDESLLLKSLKCVNDYDTHVHCKWRNNSKTTVKLWFKTEDNSELCVPYTPAPPEPGTVHCRYKTGTFSLGIKHTVFFREEKTPAVCSLSPHRPLQLAQHLRTRTPENVSTQEAGDGGRWLSWSSPYPASSTLSTNITYQLSYRTIRQDDWTTEDVMSTTLKLDKRSLLPGHSYEARVRARAAVGQWSHWSPVVTWHTEEDAEQIPSLHCVLAAEEEVMCSWKVSGELAHFITYQLACRRHRAAASERCCVNPAVSPDLGGLRYSCSLRVREPWNLQLELLPTRSAKTFRAGQHIRPKKPQQVTVREDGSNWKVEWKAPSYSPRQRLSLCYQVCYSRKDNQEETSVQVEIPEGTMYYNIPGDTLDPSELYQVQVRSLLAPGQDQAYTGVPSEWTDAVKWNSHAASWSPHALIYVSISVFVAAVFLIIYCTVPACQKRVILWVDSVPSPSKSKMLCEIKSTTNHTYIQSESTSICKVTPSDSLSTCSLDSSLLTSKDSEKVCYEQDEGCWNCDDLPSPTDTVPGSDTSGMSFSGPYIFCQASEQKIAPKDLKCEENVKGPESSSDNPASPPVLVSVTPYKQGYVCLSSPGVSRSTQDLTSHSDANANMHRPDDGEKNQHGPDEATVQTDKMEGEDGVSQTTTGNPQLSGYVSGPFSAWPQGGAIQASGYCHIPTAPV